jgi:hypothetical protein
VKEAKDFWDSRQGSLIIVAVAVVLAYAIGIKAIDTGSLQQYSITFLLFVVIVNRLIHAAFPKKK